MINGKRIVVVLPAYNAARTLEATVRELPDTVDETILVDDYSTDETAEMARRLNLTVHVHERNRGYGGNQKTCYALALEAGADVVVMTHPDYQYEPLLVTAMASMVAFGVYDAALGSRLLMGGALDGGMPLYKYIANRALTACQNVLMGAHLSEYHTGYRAYSKELLNSLPLEQQFRRFCFRQPDSGAGHFAGRAAGRNLVPHALLSGSIVYQFPPQLDLRPGRAPDRAGIPPRQVGHLPLADFSVSRKPHRCRSHAISASALAYS